MKKLYFLVLFSLLISISLLAQNKLWGDILSFHPYKSFADDNMLFSTDMHGIGLTTYAPNDTVFGDFENKSPVSEILVSKYSGLFYVTFKGDTSSCIYKYDKDLDSILTRYVFPQNKLPIGNLLEYSNGDIYGFYSYFIYKYDGDSIINNLADLSEVGVIYNDFDEATLVEANDGNIYGLSLYGGTGNLGVIFKYDVVNDTIIKMFDFDSSNHPSGYFFKTRNGNLYFTCYNKIMEYDYINNTLITIFQSSETNVPNYLVEGFNNDFYGYSLYYDNHYMMKIDINTNSIDTIYSSYDISVNFPNETELHNEKFRFAGHPTFLSNGNIVGFISVTNEDWYYAKTIKVFELINDYLDHWTLIKRSEIGTYETHINQKLVEVCYPEIINVTEVILASDSSFLEGEFQNTEGIYYDTLQNFCGCDSIITTQLVIADILYQDTLIICDGDTAYIGTNPITEQGLYYETFTVAGGDSVHTVQLIVNQGFVINETHNICPDSNAYFLGNYYDVGEYHFNYINQYGCDSIYNLYVNSMLEAEIYNNNSVFYTGSNYHFTGLNSGESQYDYTFDWIVSPSSCNVSYANTYECYITFNDTVEYTIMLLKTNSCGTDTAYFIVHPEIFIGVDDYSIDSDIRVFPNPAKEFVTIKTKFNKIKQIDIFDISGRNVKSIKNINDNKIFDIDLSQFEKGIYSLKIITNKGIILKKLIVE